MPRRPLRPALPAASPSRGFGALLLATSLALTACGGEESLDAQSISADATESAAPEVHGDADVAFAAAVLARHGQVLELSDELLDKTGVDPEVLAFATEVRDGEQAEVDRLEELLATWGEPRPTAAQGEQLLSDAEVDRFATASGPRAAAIYLEAVRTHHEQTIELAQAQLAEGESIDAVNLAAAIVRSEHAELTELEALAD